MKSLGQLAAEAYEKRAAAKWRSPAVLGKILGRQSNEFASIAAVPLTKIVPRYTAIEAARRYLRTDRNELAGLGKLVAIAPPNAAQEPPTILAKTPIRALGRPLNPKNLTPYRDNGIVDRGLGYSVTDTAEGYSTAANGPVRGQGYGIAHPVHNYPAAIHYRSASPGLSLGREAAGSEFRRGMTQPLDVWQTGAKPETWLPDEVPPPQEVTTAWWRKLLGMPNRRPSHNFYRVNTDTGKQIYLNAKTVTRPLQPEHMVEPHRVGLVLRDNADQAESIISPHAHVARAVQKLLEPVITEFPATLSRAGR